MTDLDDLIHLRQSQNASLRNSLDLGRGLNVTKSKPIIVAVDGPAGSGKSSICARVCARLGWSYVNTGALYRAIGLLAQEGAVDLSDEKAVARLVESVTQDLRWDSASQQLWHNDRNLTPLLGGEEAGRAASRIATQPAMRESLLPLQRALAMSAPFGVIVDGRDMGTVVFPNADLKIFLTASLEERSRRRLGQIAKDKEDAAQQLAFEAIKKTIAGRDEQDSGRGVAPLKQAADAIVLDTSSLSIEEVVTAMIELFRKHNLVVSGSSQPQS